jgi:hypothetical protein
MTRRRAALLLLAACALCGAAPPDDAGMPRTPEDLAVDLVLREPRVAQPVFLHFDARGRLWVVQYLQYPDPAGLRAVSRDSVWRVIYDERKPPPPYDTPEKARFRGRDRISIFSDRADVRRWAQHHDRGPPGPRRGVGALAAATPLLPRRRRR